MIFNARTSFRVFPEKWDETSDEDIVRMYRAFRGWLTMNEENMTITGSEKAWSMLRKWEEYLDKRGLSYES